MKIQKKTFGGGGGGLGSGGGGVSGWEGQVGWEQRSEACVKIQKKKFRGKSRVGGGGGVRVGVDVNGEVKLL